MLIRYLTGEGELLLGPSDIKKAFEIISRLDVPFTQCENREGRVSLFVPLYQRSSVVRELKKIGVESKKGKMRGLPNVVYRYRKRWGILVGGIICLIMVVLSERVIWQVEVKGNTTVPDKEIIEALEKLGCGIGDTYEDIDFDSLHNRFLLENKDIAWISVNMNGTYANVEVRETMHGEDKEGDQGYYNIIAKEAGQIERVLTKEGKPVVELYDTVLEGELLISGAVSYKDSFNRFESADGKVFARVNRSFEVSVPLKSVEKVPTGEKTTKKSIRIFNFNINLFLKGGIPYKSCDKITTSEQVYLFSRIPLPMFFDKCVYEEYEMRTVERTEEQAKELALKLYREKLCEVLGEGELVSKKVYRDFDGEAYTIGCRLYCIDDIAERVPLTVEFSEKQNNTEAE